MRRPGRGQAGLKLGGSLGTSRRSGSRAGPGQPRGRLTSSSLWLRMPRTRSCKFLSNMRSMLPLTILRAITAAAGGLEPREA